MLNNFRASLPYMFPVYAGTALMILEMNAPDWVMVLLLCTTLIAHAWLNKRAMRAYAAYDRDRTVDATINALRLLDRGVHRQSD